MLWLRDRTGTRIGTDLSSSAIVVKMRVLF